MAYIKSVRNHTPQVGEGTFVAETAVLIGDVTVGKDSSIWYNVVLRGDVNSVLALGKQQSSSAIRLFFCAMRSLFSCPH